MPSGPYHLVSKVTRKHHGPFTTESDAVLAKNIATPLWANADVMDDEVFTEHLRLGDTGAS